MPMSEMLRQTAKAKGRAEKMFAILYIHVRGSAYIIITLQLQT